MEVHAHTHTARKKWTHYLWEFIMLFLAVFCGFLAENKREHLVNKKNERKLIFALYNDLVKDTVRLHHLIDEYTPAFHSWIDSCHYDIDSLTLKGNERRIGKALFNATYWEVYSAPEVAITILKNPTAFNLIESEALKKDILNFNSSLNDYEKYSTFLAGMQHSIDTSFASLVNREAGRKYLDGLSRTAFFLTDKDIPDSVVFKTYDKAVFMKYVNKLDQMDAKIHDVHYFHKEILSQDIKLLKTLTEEYHIKTN